MRHPPCQLENVPYTELQFGPAVISNSSGATKYRNFWFHRSIDGWNRAHRLSPWCMDCIKLLCPKCNEQGRKRAWWINVMRLGKITLLIFILIPFPSSQVARASRPPSRSWWSNLSNMVPLHQSKSIVPVYRILTELTQGSDSSGWRTEHFSTILYL